MHKNTIDAFIDRIIELSSNTVPWEETKNKSVEMLHSKDITLFLINDAKEDYHTLLKDLLNIGDWGDKFSEKFMKKRINEVIVDTYNGDNKRSICSKFFKPE